MSAAYGDLHVHFAMSGSIGFWRGYLDELRAGADQVQLDEARRLLDGLEQERDTARAVAKEAKQARKCGEKHASVPRGDSARLQQQVNEQQRAVEDLERRCGYKTTFAEIERRLTALQETQAGGTGDERWAAFSSCMNYVGTDLLSLHNAYERLLEYNAREYKRQGVVYVEFSLYYKRLVENSERLMHTCSDLEQKYGVRFRWLAALNRTAVPRDALARLWQVVTKKPCCRIEAWQPPLLPVLAPLLRDSDANNCSGKCWIYEIDELNIRTITSMFENGGSAGFTEAKSVYEQQLEVLEGAIFPRDADAKPDQMLGRYLVGLDLHGKETASPIVPFIWPAFTSFANRMRREYEPRFGFRIHAGEMPPDDFPSDLTVDNHDHSRRNARTLKWFVTQLFVWYTCLLLRDGEYDYLSSIEAPGTWSVSRRVCARVVPRACACNERHRCCAMGQCHYYGSRTSFS